MKTVYRLISEYPSQAELSGWCLDGYTWYCPKHDPRKEITE